jgi:hypothetical protein
VGRLTSVPARRASTTTEVNRMASMDFPADHGELSDDALGT